MAVVGLDFSLIDLACDSDLYSVLRSLETSRPFEERKFIVESIPLSRCVFVPSFDSLGNAFLV